jgi:glycosyltransferase involved in cell wall biosynthesis
LLERWGVTFTDRFLGGGCFAYGSLMSGKVVLFSHQQIVIGREFFITLLIAYWSMKMNLESEDLPLLTLAILTYNQEKFIKDALQSAFAQTYLPLQIVLSDDASRDGTFDIMKEMVADYQGQAEIVLNQNEVNLGIGAHLNKVVSLSKGALLIAGAGDDVSESTRVQEYYRAWSSRGCCDGCIYSSLQEIDEDNKLGKVWLSDVGRNNMPLIKMINNLSDGVLGASNAWTPSLFDVFGPLNDKAVYEDRIIAFRAALLGEIIYIDKPLVRYRVHGGNISIQPATLGVRQEHFRRRAIVLRNYLKDLMSSQLRIGLPKRLLLSLVVIRALVRNKLKQIRVGLRG